MAGQNSEEKRTFVRADLATRVKVQPVSREEFEHHKAMRLGGISGGVSADDGSLPEGKMGYIFDRLSRIEEKLDRVLQKLDPDSYSLATVARFESGDVRYSWLNTVVAVGTGEQTGFNPKYTIYEIR